MTTTSNLLLKSSKVDGDLLIKRSLLFGLVAEGLFEEKNNLLYVVLKTLKRYPSISNSMLIYNLSKRFQFSESVIKQMVEALTTDVAGTPPLVWGRKNTQDARRPEKIFYSIQNTELADQWLSALELENSALKLVNVVIGALEQKSKGS
jgi:hypothetical protein